MARIRRTISNILVVPAGGLPAAGLPPWYSGRGDSASGGTSDPGGVGGTQQEGAGLNVEGDQADHFVAHLEVVRWGAVTAVEL
jgi:hypothetical protein